MTGTFGLLILLSALCCSLADNVMRCVDSETSAVHSYGDTWLRWKGQRVEYCRCALRGRVRCHDVPVINCYQSRCYNGGTCKEAVYTSDFICQCPPGFTGSQCEINTREKCVVGQGAGYRGTWSISHSGAECINWNSTTLRGRRFTAKRPDASSLGLGNHNFCRNPDKDDTPWCYVYKGTQVNWEFCSLPKCTEDKYQECKLGSGQSYRGTVAVTQSGASCLPWDSPLVKRKLYNAWRADALNLGLGGHSFCRNPDGDVGPWCHIYRNMQLTWELCDIPKCARHPTIITTLGPRGPTTNNNNRGTCGQRTDNSLNRPSFRMFGGRESDISEQPWQAAVNVYQARYRRHFHRCGGILIDSCWVLSAAHCFEDRDEARKLQVVLGRTFRKQNSTSEQIFNVEKYWIHEKFDNETYDNDIAPLSQPQSIYHLSWTGYVRLWPQERCVPDILSGRTITTNMLCAGDTRGLDDACKGDSGGPLVCQNNNRMTLMGVISWGDGCGQKDKPGVYTRVTHYIDWIEGKMKANPDF
uniref:Plasminogen activator n=1 Tax=Myripristis murdjan TaxID=586833 RepID=A0A667XZQ1_9TELE